jgi:hypothetical protein
MRRESDIHAGRRSGRGRRARDVLLVGDPPGDEAEGLAAREGSELGNLLLFVGDDLREAALAVGGIERYLVSVHGALAEEGGRGARLTALLDADDVEDRLGELEQALDSLRRRLHRLRRPVAPVPLARPR